MEENETIKNNEVSQSILEGGPSKNLVVTKPDLEILCRGVSCLISEFSMSDNDEEVLLWKKLFDRLQALEVSGRWED